MLETICNLEIRYMDLSKISRFGSFPMIYPQDLNMHHFSTWSVSKNLINEVEKFDVPKINWELERIMCLIHDDPEFPTVDFPSDLKLSLTKSQLMRLNQYEESKFDFLLERYGTFLDFDYIKVLKLANEKKIIESQLMSYADKICGFSEMIHETLVGNYSLNTQGSVLDNYLSQFRDLHIKLPLLAPFFASDSIYNFTKLEFLEEFSEQVSNLLEQKISTIPTIDSIQKTTGIKIYDFYVDSIKNTSCDYTIEILTNRNRKRDVEHSTDFYIGKLKEFGII